MVRYSSQSVLRLWRGLRWLTTGAVALALLFVAVWVGLTWGPLHRSSIIALAYR
jgi:hypothetical protein